MRPLIAICQEDGMLDAAFTMEKDQWEPQDVKAVYQGEAFNVFHRLKDQRRKGSKEK